MFNNINELLLFNFVTDSILNAVILQKNMHVKSQEQ